MRRKKIIIPICLLAFVACNCNTERSMIREVAYGYLDAMGNYRIKEAAPFSTSETKTITLKYIEEKIMPRVDSSYLEKNTPATIQIKGIRMINDSTARVGYHKDTPITHQNDSLTLVKRKGKWQAKVLIQIPSVLKAMEGLADTTRRTRRFEEIQWQSN